MFFSRNLFVNEKMKQQERNFGNLPMRGGGQNNFGGSQYNGFGQGFNEQGQVFGNRGFGGQHQVQGLGNHGQFHGGGGGQGHRNGAFPSRARMPSLYPSTIADCRVKNSRSFAKVMEDEESELVIVQLDNNDHTIEQNHFRRLANL